MYQSTKKYDHNVGLSCSFRQWRADSHCNTIHGYPLAIKLVFRCIKLDDKNWCIDFGGLKQVKFWLESKFDHTTLVAEDDPQLSWFEEGERLGTMKLVRLPAVGCEKVAEYIFDHVEDWLKDYHHSPRVMLDSVEVSEHSGNSAIYTK